MNSLVSRSVEDGPSVKNARGPKFPPFLPYRFFFYIHPPGIYIVYTLKKKLTSQSCEIDRKDFEPKLAFASCVCYFDRAWHGRGMCTFVKDTGRWPPPCCGVRVHLTKTFSLLLRAWEKLDIARALRGAEKTKRLWLSVEFGMHKRGKQWCTSYVLMVHITFTPPLNS